MIHSLRKPSLTAVIQLWHAEVLLQQWAWQQLSLTGVCDSVTGYLHLLDSGTFGVSHTKVQCI